MDLLGLMRNFVRVAEAGSFSAAARDLNVGQPTLSRQAADLEEHLRARLLHRSSTGLSLTEDGALSWRRRAGRWRRWRPRPPRWASGGARCAGGFGSAARSHSAGCRWCPACRRCSRATRGWRSSW